MQLIFCLSLIGIKELMEAETLEKAISAAVEVKQVRLNQRSLVQIQELSQQKIQMLATPVNEKPVLTPCPQLPQL